ncbi:hypothetical protein SKAU_G00278580 [Synaphobranchus kaupii]|uniref:DDE Tnp4 domain-containing protein n=1 Tax=Synaphobranchus kaupii TaxID=118154 RepID=A0A9Q1EWN8_SYNKA|nr:hypothetical protein SKAU_G00278580 [Synaphobranchus kaupii]
MCFAIIPGDDSEFEGFEDESDEDTKDPDYTISSEDQHRDGDDAFMHLYPPRGYALLGDGGYPCLEDPIQIITPYREPVQGPVEARFNRHHSKARSIIERAFGLMKSRWRSILFSALEVHPTFAPKVVAACAVLHNICLADVDALEEERVSYEYYPDLVPILTQETPGQHLRARLAEQVSAPVSCPASLQDHIYFHCNTPL